MAVIKAIAPQATNGKFDVAPTALTGADTLVYSPGKLQTLYLYNTTAASVTVTLDGDGATSVTPSGLGAPIDVTGGYAIAIAAGTLRAVALPSVRAYLAGTVNVTGGVAGVTAWVAE
ncbi:hypothetical protein Psm1vBMR14_gp17 [Pseudomonas phage MR14]|nr:hypothetical protein Psm1vBMR14_gp17 [Pseudomonas phage MR14]